MHAQRRFQLTLAILVLALTILACEMPTPSQPSPTVTPYTPATEPAATEPAATEPATTEPATAEPATAEPPTAEPPTTEPPPAGWLPDGTIALYATGPWEDYQVYALTADGAISDLGRSIYGQATISHSGRWIASLSNPRPATTITAVNLEDGTTHTIPITPDYDVYGIVFDLAETRLAFMEMGGLGADGVPWAIVVANLADGSTTRFDTQMAVSPRPEMLTGQPVGWTAAGSELLLDTFAPFTEGNWDGVWSLGLPPGTASAPLYSLPRRELVPAGEYLTPARLSPDGTHILYLDRDYDYTPDDYEVLAYDLAVNELWTADTTSGARTILVDVTDGSALARAAAWSPDGTQVMFTQGTYAGETFGSLTVKVRDGSGSIRDVGPAPLPSAGFLGGLDWCAPNLALVTAYTTNYEGQLYILDTTSGGASLIASSAHVLVLGCVP